MNPATRLCLVAAIVLNAGCSAPQPPPSNAYGPRLDPATTTRGEAGQREILPEGWLEFADSASQQLVGDLSKLEEFNGPYRVTIIFGDIINKTRVLSTAEFEQFRTNFRGALVNSKTFSDKAVFRTERARMESIRQRELPQGGSSSPGLKPLNEDYTYILQGEMYATLRSDSALYSLTLQLVNFSSGEGIWQNLPYNFKQAAVR